MKKKEINWWMATTIFLTAAFVASLFTVFYIIKLRSQPLLEWKFSCRESGGTWYSRVLDDYREYVCRID